ncbi:MAG TPA: fluoride efflux transporter CrcB [Spirochaetota bacterium]|nr:fluoride efflux transporter CrcB [Spirochaetota bacterium]HOM38817.1 fluoride efflux transporter CrcB [Spirochaetota bacterium]HPQ49875.1 fluoride efflux transporter CrcB [Spirochaetota bacterium]
MKALFVFLGGGVGALLRFSITTIFPTIEVKHFFIFPVGTLLVNIIASFIIGLLVGFDFVNPMPSEYKLLIGTGICGGLSTFSTFAIENLFMLSEKSYILFIFNLILNNFLTLLFAVLGYFLGKYLGVING